MPATGVEITIDGIDELLGLYMAGDSVAESLLEDGMERAINYGVRNAIMAPEETEANQPPPPYYIRDVGTQYKNGTNRGESQHISHEESWDTQIEKIDSGLVGTIQPTATYAPYLHGLQSQIPIHASRGWRKVDAIASDINDTIQDMFAEQAAKLKAYLGGGK